MLQEKCLDKSIPVPLYFQLKNLIVEEIENGSYAVGSMIPTEKELSEIFQISRTTVRQAITELVREGRLYRVKSKGTFVSHPMINQEFINTLKSFNEEMQQAGRVPGTEVLSLKLVRMSEEIAMQMGKPADSKAIYLYRKRLADGIPVVRVETFLPYDICDFCMDHDYTKESLYSVLSQREETRVTRVSRICEARSADAEDARVLEIRRGRPVHHFVTMGYNRDGRMIEYSIADYRGDQSRFRVEINMDK